MSTGQTHEERRVDDEQGMSAFLVTRNWRRSAGLPDTPDAATGPPQVRVLDLHAVDIQSHATVLSTCNTTHRVPHVVGSSHTCLLRQGNIGTHPIRP